MDLISVKSKTHKRVGRGLSSGQGKTAGRGTKGQRSRSGFNIPRKFEGGQTPLSMRLSKMPGFKSQKPKSEVVSLDVISANYKAGETVTIKSLVEKNIVSGKFPVKVLGNGELTISVTIDKAIKISKSALELIAKAAKKTEKPATEKVEKVEKADKPKTTKKTTK